MSGLNKAMLIGNLGADPEVRYTNNGQAVANFRLATNEHYKSQQGERKEKTEWHNIVAWEQTAVFVQNNLLKGASVFVEGRLQTRNWTDNKDQKHYRTEIVAYTVTALDRKDGPKESGQGQQSGVQPGADEWADDPDPMPF